MELNKQEKEVIIGILKKQLELVHKAEKFTDTPAGFFAGEAKYDQFLEDLIEKLKI